MAQRLVKVRASFVIPLICGGMLWRIDVSRSIRTRKKV
jgi:hypothetical protein